MSYASGDWDGPLAASGLSVHDLWLAYLALDGYLRHHAAPSRSEHNVLAQALNERLHDLGYDWPVPYR